MEEFEGLSGFDDIGAAVFVEAEDFTLVGPGGSGESGGAGETLFAVNLGAGFGVVGGEVATVEESVDLVIVELRCHVELRCQESRYTPDARL